jgi:hypothetical protein
LRQKKGGMSNKGVRLGFLGIHVTRE